jgi:hypothetical protein
MRCQSPQERAAGPRILHVEHEVCAVVRLGSIAQHGCLDVVEFQDNRTL